MALGLLVRKQPQNFKSNSYWLNSISFLIGRDPNRIRKYDFVTFGKPMMNTPLDYNLDKPLVIGEFSSSCSGEDTIEEMYEYFYENKFDGAWAWQLYDDGEGHCSDGKVKTLSQVFKNKIRNIRT